MKINFIFLLSISTLLIANTTQAFDPSDLKVNLTLAEPYKTDYLVGDPIKFDVEIQNLSDEPVTIVQPLEGSSEGRRYPVYQFNVKYPLDVSKPLNHIFDGMTGNIQANCFVTIPPDGTFQPPFWFQPPFTPFIAGKHDISYVVGFDAEKEAYEGYMKPFEWTSELNDLFSKVPKVDIQSATISVDVVSNEKTMDSSVHCLMGMPQSEISRLFFNNMQNDLYEFGPFDTFITKMQTSDFEVLIHFDYDNIVDGVSIQNYDIKDFPNEIKLYSLNDLLLWSRGHHEEIPHKVVYEGEKIKAIHVGFLSEWFKGRR